MQHQNKKAPFTKIFSNSLLFKLTAYMVGFTVMLIVIMFYYLNQPYALDDALNAQDGYLYAKMVESWGASPDIVQIQEDIENINLPHNQVSYDLQTLVDFLDHLYLKLYCL